MNRPNWKDWDEAAFDEARREGRPVLLFLRASWCRFCRQLEEEVFSQDAVAEALAEGVVCLRVDKDRRPDLNSRYYGGGWPTLAWLDSEGEPLATDSYLEASQLLERLRSLKNPEQSAAAEERTGPAPLPASLPPLEETGASIVEHVSGVLVRSVDPEYGGWGKQHKFPHPEAIDFSLARWSKTGDPDLLHLVRLTLRKMQAGAIHDSVEGGFYRYATQRDWSMPNHEKMLDANAARAYAYLEAYQALGDESFKRTAEGVIDWMQTTLLDPETGAFRGSQDSDPAYAHLSGLPQRERHGAPPCDPTLFANWNGMAVSTLLKASVVLEREDLADVALRALDFLMTELYDHEHGVYHYWDGTWHLPGLLSDQAYVLRALVDAMQIGGENRYMPQALRLAELSVEALRGADGSFFDTRHDPRARGHLRRRNRSILENSVMAEALLRLGYRARRDDLLDVARGCLESFSLDYKRYGHFVAGYARAVDLALVDPVHVTVVGPRHAEHSQGLWRAALRPYVASRIVEVLDPEEDAELIALAGLPAPHPSEHFARAYVQRGRLSFAETADVDRLPALMTRTEREA